MAPSRSELFQHSPAKGGPERQPRRNYLCVRGTVLNPGDTISNRTPGFHRISCKKRYPKAWYYVHLWAISNDLWRIGKMVIRRFAGGRYQWVSQEGTRWWRTLWPMWKLVQRLEATNNRVDAMTCLCSFSMNKIPLEIWIKVTHVLSNTACLCKTLHISKP